MTEHKFRVEARDSDAAVAQAVNRAGRDGINIFDIARVRRSPKGRQGIEFYNGEFVRTDEYVVVIRSC